MQRAHGLFLGDAVRPRLLDPRELSIDHGASAARARHRQSRHPHRRDGARSHARAATDEPTASVSSTSTSGKQLQADGARRRARRERLRNGAHSAQFQDRRVSPRTRQLQRQGRQISHGHGRRRSRAARFRCWKTCRRTTRTAPAAASCMSPWWLYKSSTPASSVSRAAITSNSAAAGACPAAAPVPDWNGSPAAAMARKFKEDARRYYGSLVYFAGRGEMIPNENSFCEIDPQVKDKWGIPVLRFHWQWSEHETRQAAHMQKTFARDHRSDGRQGAQPGRKRDGAKAIAPGGSIIHEVGGAIMGADPQDSVHNAWCQTWDVENLFLTDGALSRPTPTRIPRSPSWPSPGARPTTFSTACAARSSDGSPHHHQMGPGRRRVRGR